MLLPAALSEEHLYTSLLKSRLWQYPAVPDPEAGIMKGNYMFLLLLGTLDALLCGISAYLSKMEGGSFLELCGTLSLSPC